MIEVDGLQWRKAAASSGNGACVQLARGEDGTVYLRDSKDPYGPVMMYTCQEIAAFLDGAKNGEFDDLIDPGGVDGPASARLRVELLEAKYPLLAQRTKALGVAVRGTLAGSRTARRFVMITALCAAVISARRKQQVLAQ